VKATKKVVWPDATFKAIVAALIAMVIGGIYLAHTYLAMTYGEIRLLLKVSPIIVIIIGIGVRALTALTRRTGKRFRRESSP
jgi:hypothetical protein